MKPRIESNFTVSQQVKFAFGKPRSEERRSEERRV